MTTPTGNVERDAQEAALFFRLLTDGGVPLAAAVPISQSWVTARQLKNQSVTVIDGTDPPEPWQDK